MKGRLFQGVKQLLPNYVVKSGSGSYVTTQCGRKMLDFACGIGVTNLGHCHPKVTASAQKAVGEIVHAQQNIMKHENMMLLTEKLANLEISKRAKLDSWFYWNSGAEAVEASIKLARQSTNKPNVIVVSLGYHGRTYGTMGMTTSGTIYRSGFFASQNGVFVAPFPYSINGPYGPSYEQEHWDQMLGDRQVGNHSYWGSASREIVDRDTARCLDSLELMLRTQTSPTETAAIILEPVLGEGGYVPSPPGYLLGLQNICKRHNILLIVDEVQTGFGRTGEMFASDWLDNGAIKPDILIMAKGIANGFPLSAIATRSEISALQPPGSMGGTYGGNSVSCAAALAVLDILQEENILDNVKKSERVVRESLNQLQDPDLVKEIRGKGLMIGIEFNRPSSAPPGWVAKEVSTRCAERGLIVLACGPYDTVRLIPPLNVSESELKEGMAILDEVITFVSDKIKVG